MEAGLVIGGAGREDFEFGGSTKGNDALVRPAEGDAAVFGGQQAVEGVQDLIGLGGQPGGGALGKDLDRPLKLDDANFS
jgi:hypothetical protein